MNIPRQLLNQAALMAVGFLLLGSTKPALGQSGPPMPPVLFFDSYSFQATNLDSDYGYAPIGESNAFIIPFWDANALWLDTTNEIPAYVHYNLVETNGFVNIDLGAGAIFAQVIPDWASADTNQLGQGPGARGYLLASGDFSSGSPEGLWAIYVDAGGTNIYFGGVSNSVATTYVSAPISWATNSLHEIGVYYRTNSELFLDGQWAGTGGPVTIVPATNTWTNGFYVGSDNLGYEQWRGIFPYLELDTTNVFLYDTNYLTEDWAWDTNSYDTWLVPLVGGGGFHTDGTGGVGGLPPTPTNTVNTNFSAYSNFWLSITNNGGEAQVDLINPCLGLTYVILTNAQVEPMSSTHWQPWVVLVGSNTVTPAPPLTPSSNTLYFSAELVLETGTNGLPDWWQMEYFGSLNVDPYADPDLDGLCNLDEYVLGLNPTNAHTLSSLHTDAQALVLAYTNSTGCVYHLAIADGPNTNTLLVTISPTVVGTNYQIYSQVVSATNGPWIVETNFLGTNTSTTVAICLNGRTLSLIGGYGEDSDGDGLPDGYEVLATLTDPYLPDTGLTGISDGYKDPDGDGFVNLAEYYNGTDPHVFNTPAGPANLNAVAGTGGTFNISWSASTGAVQGYLLTIQLTNNSSITVTNSAAQLSYNAPANYQSFSVQAIYALGLSGSAAFYGLSSAAYTPLCTVAYGPSNRCYLIAPLSMSNLSAIRVSVSGTSVSYPFGDYDRYLQQAFSYPYGDGYTNYTFDVALARFTNGMALLTDSELPPWGNYYLYMIGIDTRGLASANWSQRGWYWACPFVDGTTQMKQNIAFQLRVATVWPFAYDLDWPGAWYYFSYPMGYVYADFYYYDYLTGYPYSPLLYPFESIEDNYFFQNFVFNTAVLNSTGELNTGFDGIVPDESPYYTSYTNANFLFPTFSYVSQSNNAPVPALLSQTNTQWVGYCYLPYLGTFGLSKSGNIVQMTNSSNFFGLSYESLELAVAGPPVQFWTLEPGGEVSISNFSAFYADTAQPELQAVGYYFARPGVDPQPGELDTFFSTTNATPPLILGTVGQSMLLAGYEKEAVLNGNTYAYLGQYFTNAFVMSNGVVTTNPAGMVGEYGEFLPTLPGQVALFTRPDPDQTNIQGQCNLDIIRLSLDVNHDGIMDESFTGPDNTGPNAPYVFWANNDYDRWDFDTIDQIYQEDDVESNSTYAESLFSSASVPDCEFLDGFGNRTIPCPRDLEDYARLWVSGVSNTLPVLPEGSTVTLNWGDVGAPNTNNPTIDIFQAADADGGIGYLTNLTTASNQINLGLCQYVGRLGPGSNIVLNNFGDTNGWAGDHYIFCGVGYGFGQLSLTISDGSGNQLAQSSQYIQILDIKQMYERWTVGDTPGVTPQNIALPAEDDLPPGTKAFQYPYDKAFDTNDNYILSVHGYNIALWEAERFSETAFKRLYWQGYTGRFGSFRWPAHSNPTLYDNDEFASWESGTGLYHLLVLLNSYYPGKVYLFAHSQGNMAAGEALRLAGTNTIVNAYIAAQGAVCAHTYDPTTPNRSATFTTPDRYAQYWTNGAPCYFNGSTGAAVYMNFYNTNDWALTIPWPLTQNTKPDSPAKLFNLLFGYDYIGTHFVSFWNTPFHPITTILTFPTNTYTIFAFCDQSQSQALGAQTYVGGAFSTNKQIDLASSPYNFGKLHVYHSGEFRSDNMQRWPFWNQVLKSYGLK